MPEEYTYVGEIPLCDFCQSDWPNPCATPAVLDGKTKLGPWANMCEAHNKRYGIGLGTGKGQRFILRTTPAGLNVEAAVAEAEALQRPL